MDSWLVKQSDGGGWFISRYAAHYLARDGSVSLWVYDPDLFYWPTKAAAGSFLSRWLGGW